MVKTSKVVLLIIIFIGVILMVTNFNKSQYLHQETIYKYIPRTFDEEMDEREYVSDIFSTMFSDDSVWVLSKNNFDRDKQNDINKFFISQY